MSAPKKGKIMSKKSNTARVLEEVVAAPPAPVVPSVPVDEKGRKTVVNMSMEQIEAAGCKNTSQTMRFLASQGYSTSAIAKFLNKRYQHVRNVLTQELKKPVAGTVVPSQGDANGE